MDEPRTSIDCHRCEDGYFYDSAYRACRECDIAGCATCAHHPLMLGDYIVPDCTSCEEDWALVHDYFMDIPGWKHRVCDNGEEVVAECAVRDHENPWICKRCGLEFFWDMTELECTECENLVNHCSTCNHEGTECTSCEEGYYLDGPLNCFNPHCEDYEMESADYCDMVGWDHSDCMPKCETCEEGYAMLWDLAVCVDPYEYMDMCRDSDYECHYKYNKFDKVMVRACPDGWVNDPSDWGFCKPCN